MYEFLKQAIILWGALHQRNFDEMQEVIQKFSDWADNEMNNNKHSLRSNTKGCGDRTH
jgi:hypothetical protein